MPVTKTAKRALRSSNKKAQVNRKIRTNLEVALRIAKKSSKGRSASGRKKSNEAIIKAISLADRAAKKHLIHKNKAARIKSTLSKLLPKERPAKTSKTKHLKKK